VERAAGGEEIIVARNGKPKAMLVPLAKKKNYTYGAGKGKWKGAEHILDNLFLSAVNASFTNEPHITARGPASAICSGKGSK